MIRETSSTQVSLCEFDWPFQNKMDPENRWIKLAQMIPWEPLIEAYCQKLNATEGRPAVKARVVIGALIIKHKLVLSDRETIGQIQENPYMQYFIGLDSYTSDKPFDASLFVSIRRRMGEEVFEEFSQSIQNELSQVKRGKKNAAQESKNESDEDPRPPSQSVDDEASVASTDPQSQSQVRQGKLLLDATVADQAIRYPTDVSLLNEAREQTEQIIDCLYKETQLTKKPRTYRENARRDYLNFAKRRKPTRKTIRKAIKQQLQYLRRNLSHIEALLELFEQGHALPIENWLLRRYWVIPHLYAQQKQMFDERTHRCENRIVSIHQPWVRPIVRGKQHKPTEFGAKINVSMDEDGLSRVDHFSWEAYNEGQDLKEQVEAYKRRYGYYPEAVLADPIYGTRDNRAYLKSLGIRYGGKPLGRPRKTTKENAEQLKAEKKQRTEDYRQRIPIEGKFGQGKGGYRLNYIRAKRSDTSQAWVNGLFFVMNLLVLQALVFLSFLRASQCSVSGNIAKTVRGIYQKLKSLQHTDSSLRLLTRTQH